MTFTCSSVTTLNFEANKHKLLCKYAYNFLIHGFFQQLHFSDADCLFIILKWHFCVTFFYPLWRCCGACEVLVPWPGIQSSTPSIGSVESYPSYFQGSPSSYFIFYFFHFLQVHWVQSTNPVILPFTSLLSLLSSFFNMHILPFSPAQSGYLKVSLYFYPRLSSVFLTSDLPLSQLNVLLPGGYQETFKNVSEK